MPLYRLTAAGIDGEAVRTAGMLVVATRVLSLLAEHRIAGPFQDRLAELRRAIGLGELSVESARQSLDETLRGVSPVEHLRRHFSLLEESSAQTAAAQDRLQRALKTLSDALAAAPTAVPTNAVDEPKAARQDATTALQRNTKHAETINNLVFALWLQAPEIIRDVKPVIEKYRDGRKALRARQETLLSELKSLSEQMAQRRGVAGGAVV